MAEGYHVRMTQAAESDIQWNVLEIFEECQSNSLSHGRLCARLKNLYDKSRFSYFCDEFFELCRYSLVSNDRTAQRERTVDFVTRFALFCGKSDDNPEDPADTLNNRLLIKLFLFCIKYNECPNPAVRFRCTQIIHKLLEGIGDNGVIPDELFQNLQTILLRRVQDVKSNVRVQAVQALARMQDPTLADCPAVETFIWLAQHDATAEVRRAAIAAMVLTTKTLPSLIERCRDVSDSVRRTAYKILAGRSVLRPLSIAKRIRILQDGLSDRSPDVKQAARELVISWFNASERDPIQILRRLDTEGVPKTSQLLLDNLFEILSESEFRTMVHKWVEKYLTELRVLKPDMFTAEAAFFWRALAEHLTKRSGNQGTVSRSKAQASPACDGTDDEGPVALEKILPSVSAYVDLAKDLVDQLIQLVHAEEFGEKIMEQECVVEHVLRLTASLDLSDEFGRRRLMGLVHDWIVKPTVPSTLSPHLLKVHALFESNLRKRVNHVIEMISELCDPVEPGSSVEEEAQQQRSELLADATAPSMNEQSGAVSVSHPQSPAVSKDEERVIRLKIAKIEVKLNELNESMHTCILRKQFEKATGLRDECAGLESERSLLMNVLHGQLTVSITSKPDIDPDTSDTVQMPTQIAPPSTADEGDGDEKVVNPESAMLQRCSANVLIKANRLAALVVQQSPTLWRLPASLRSLLDSLIFPSIQHADPSVRNQAILSLGLVCSMDLQLALQYLPLFYSALRVDHEMISETALRCIIDCLLIFGFRPFHEAKITPNTRIASTDEAAVVTDTDDEDDGEVSDASNFIVFMRNQDNETTDGGGGSATTRREEMSKTAARLLKPIIALLDSEDEGLLTTSALGLAKLLIYDRFVSSHVLSHLILLWFNPLSADRATIRRTLACFFTDYACGNRATSSGQTNDSEAVGCQQSSHQSALADAVLPTLTALIRASASSPLSEVEAIDVAALLVRLTDRSLLIPHNPVERKPVEQPEEHVDQDDEDKEAGEDVPAKEVVVKDNIEDNPHHDRLALLLSAEILKAPQSAEAKLYLRMLCQLRPSSNNLAVHSELLLLADAMFKFADRSSTLLLHRFRKQIHQSLERLGLQPDQVLRDAKQARTAAADEEADTTLVAGEKDASSAAHAPTPAAGRHPTLLGSARVNVHWLNERESGAGNMGNTSPVFGVDGSPNKSRANRTLLGKSVMDKSSRHVNILAFSESDDSDEDVTFRTSSGPTRRASAVLARQSSHSKKPNNKIQTQCAPPVIESVTVSAAVAADADDEDNLNDQETSEEGDKENQLRRSARRSESGPQSPVQSSTSMPPPSQAPRSTSEHLPGRTRRVSSSKDTPSSNHSSLQARTRTATGNVRRASTRRR